MLLLLIANTLNIGAGVTATGEPSFTPNADAAAVAVGVFGITISPYLFFWQASEEVEVMQAKQGAAPLPRDTGAAVVELRRIGWDTWSGMFFSDISAYFIILATAVTLNVAGITDIDTAAEAAAALQASAVMPSASVASLTNPSANSTSFEMPAALATRPSGRNPGGAARHLP